MREIRITKNENEQRLDRFLRKYLSKASKGFIYKMIRKKNIKVNGERVKPETMIYEGDTIQLYMSDETIDKFVEEKAKVKSNLTPNIIFEDENIILINKPIGILSHGSNAGFEENIVDSMISYLIQKEEYIPRIERTFTPAICNRLDRNTSGIIIGGKNYDALKSLNEGIKKGNIRRFYKTIVKGTIDNDFSAKDYLIKKQEKNIVEIKPKEIEGSKEIITNIKVLDNKRGYSLLEVELITGRTHQIRGHLDYLGYPVIGDRKYGNADINKKFKDDFKLDNQWLHGYRIQFDRMESPLEYLNGQSFIAETKDKYKDIEETIFNTRG